MQSTCILCYEQNECWILPPCNHKEICWKCCLKLIQGSIFSCPICKDKSQSKSQLLFVDTTQMHQLDYQSIMKNKPYRSNKNTFFFYSNQQVANKIQSQTSFHCQVCNQVLEDINSLKKHLNNLHRLQFCDICLQNRKCIINQQNLYRDFQLINHMKHGQYSASKQLILYHPICEFCNKRFYDLQGLKFHMKISYHQTCHLCFQNFSKYKYVYYKNYQQLQRHHKKSHFVCSVGECITKKIENVFISELILEQHKKIYHQNFANKKKKKQRVENILLGFNKKQDQQQLQFDQIGKDFIRQFTMFLKKQKIQKQSHSDQFIDIRQFYPEIIKINYHFRPEQTQKKLNQLYQNVGSHQKQPNLGHIPIYKPLQMTCLHKNQIQHILRACFQRQADLIGQIFFTKRNQYRSFNDYFQAIEKIMKRSSIVAFYIAFPQMIRFMKDENKNKKPMDDYYLNRLRKLRINKQFLFHSINTYLTIIQHFRHILDQQVIQRLQNQQVNLDLYAKYMKQMNNQFYIQNQSNIFYVSKDKILNIYHMIERCKTKDLIKMNWLLKVGLTTQSYNQLTKIFYMTKQYTNNTKKLFKFLSIKQIALLHAYLITCIQIINDQKLFEKSKLSACSYYFTRVLDELYKTPHLSKKQIDDLRKLQGQASILQKKVRQQKKRGVIVDEQDCPSLLVINIDQPIKKSKPEIQLGIGRASIPAKWDEQAYLKKKKKNIIHQQQEQFPSLGPSKQTKKQNKLKQKQEQFPVFNFNQKFITKKQVKKQQPKISQYLGFGSKKVNRSTWNEQKTRQNLQKKRLQQRQQKRLKQQLQKQQRQQLLKMQKQQKLKKQKNKNQIIKKQQEKKQKKQNQIKKNIVDQQQQMFKRVLQQSLKTAAQDQKRRLQKIQNKDSKSKIQNKNGKNPIQKLGLFQKIQQQSKITAIYPSGEPDIDLQQQQIKIAKIENEKKKKKIQKIIQDDDFDTILDTNKNKQQISIVNRLINQSKQVQQKSIISKQRKDRRKKKRNQANDSDSY